MPTPGELADAHLGEDLAHHCAVCRGEYCAACDAYLPQATESRRGLRLCFSCWPDPSVPMHPLHISLQWDSEGWTLCICNSTADSLAPKVSVWLLLRDRSECTAVMDRYLCRRKDRAEFDKISSHAGHAAIVIFAGPRRLAALVKASRRDPRNGYEKRQARTLQTRAETTGKAAQRRGFL